MERPESVSRKHRILAEEGHQKIHQIVQEKGRITIVQNLHADHLFLAVDGLHMGVDYTTPDILEPQLNSMMIRVSTEITVVADANKFGRAVIANVEGAHRVITDNRLNEDAAESIRSRGFELTIT